MFRTLFFALLLAAGPRGLDAQDHAGHAPYAGEEAREIKALSPAQVAELRSGAGMGMALAAELNRYPGPRHLLELAGTLDLSAEQVAAVQAAFERMQERAMALGGQIVEREREMDRLFADRTVTDDRLRELTAEVARLTGELRYVHLRAHLEVTRHLTHAQIHRYDELRGYAGGRGNHQHD